MRLRALALAGAVLVRAGRVAVGQETTSAELWPELDAYVRLSPAARLFFVAMPVISGDSRSLSETQLGGHLEMGIMPIAPRLRSTYDADRLRYLRARVGYREVWTAGSGIGERRLVADVTSRFFLPWNVLFAQRDEFDFRWLRGNYSWRFRPRVWFERETRIGGVTAVPYWSVEYFYDSRYDAWSRKFYQTGIAIPVSRRIAPEIYYGRQVDRSPNQKTVNSLGVLATLYF